MSHHRSWQFWRARRDQFDPTAIRPEAYSVGQLRAELEQLMVQVMRKAGVDLACVAIEVTHQPTRHLESLPQLACMLRIVQWERRSGLKLLLGLAHIERAMRRSVKASWLAHMIQFAGLWLHASSATQVEPVVRELAAALGALGTFGPEPAEQSMWSIDGPARSGRSTRDLAGGD